MCVRRRTDRRREGSSTRSIVPASSSRNYLVSRLSKSCLGSRWSDADTVSKIVHSHTLGMWRSNRRWMERTCLVLQHPQSIVHDGSWLSMLSTWLSDRWWGWTSRRRQSVARKMRSYWCALNTTDRPGRGFSTSGHIDTDIRIIKFRTYHTKSSTTTRALIRYRHIQSEMSYSRFATDIRRIDNIQSMMISRSWDTQWKDPIRCLTSNIMPKSVSSDSWWSEYQWGSRVILSLRETYNNHKIFRCINRNQNTNDDM